MKQLSIFIHIIITLAISARAEAGNIVETFTTVDSWPHQEPDGTGLVSPSTGLTWKFDGVKFYDDYIYLYSGSGSGINPNFATELPGMRLTHVAISFGEYTNNDVTLTINGVEYGTTDGIKANTTFSAAINDTQSLSPEFVLQLKRGYISVKSITFVTEDDNTIQCENIAEWIRICPETNASITTSATVAHAYDNSIWVIDDQDTSLEIQGTFNSTFEKGDLIGPNFTGYQQQGNKHACMIAEPSSFSRIGRDATVNPVDISYDEITAHANRMVEINDVYIIGTPDGNYSLMPGQTMIENISGSDLKTELNGTATGFIVTDRDNDTPTLLLTGFTADSDIILTDIFDFSTTGNLTFDPGYDPDQSLATLTAPVEITNKNASINASTEANKPIWIFPSEYIMFNNAGTLTFTTKEPGITITEIRIYPHNTPSSDLNLSSGGENIPYDNKYYSWQPPNAQRDITSTPVIQYSGGHLNVDRIEVDMRDTTTETIQIQEDISDENTEYEIFTITGVRIKNPSTPGIYIIRSNDRIQKVLIP